MIAIVGDFNDTPDSDPLTPLLSDGSDLRDIFDHSNFQSDGRPGTYANGTLFPHYEEMTNAAQAASDPAAIWADINP